MAKYRTLSVEELELLESSFIRFLAAQSITAEDWEKIQKEDAERHDELIDQFSDVVIEKTLHNVKKLELRTTHRILFFEFQEEEAKLFGLEAETEPFFPLDGGFQIKELAKMLDDEHFKYSLISGEKPYENDRLREIFEVIQQGARIPTDEVLFNFVLKLFKKPAT